MAQYLLTARLVRASFLVGAVVTATASGAAASPLFELVGDVQGRGGLTPIVSADGPAATYFNPAMLTMASPGLDLGVFVLSEQIGINVDGRGTSPMCNDGGCDVPVVDGRGPESYTDASGNSIANPTLPTRWLREGSDQIAARPRQDAGSGHNVRAYQTVGLIAPVFRNRLTLGLYAMIPLGEFTTAKAFYNDEREQFFTNSLHPELYSDRMTATSLAFGGGVRVTPRLSLGGSFTLSLANSASAPVYVSNLNNLDTVLLDSDIGVQAAVAPHFGAVWDALDGLRIAATVHTPSAFNIKTGFKYVLATGSEQSASVDFTHAYMPLTAATGATYRLGSESGRALWLTGVLTYARWSQYKDRHSERPGGDYAWSDTLAGAIGVRYGQGSLRGWLDANFQPSPVPAQTGRSNYVDSDRGGLVAGGDYEVEFWGSRFRLGLTSEVHHLFERHVTKYVRPADAALDDYPELVRDEVPDDALGLSSQPVPGRAGLQTNNPGFPGFSSGGWLVGCSLHMSVQY
jgi:long-chain fatty acid transport protein